MVRDKEWLKKITKLVLAIERYSPDRKELAWTVLHDLLISRGPYVEKPNPGTIPSFVVLDGGKKSILQDEATF